MEVTSGAQVEEFQKNWAASSTNMSCLSICVNIFVGIFCVYTKIIIIHIYLGVVVVVVVVAVGVFVLFPPSVKKIS